MMQVFLMDRQRAVPPGNWSRRVDFSDQPGIASLYTISNTLMDILGPVFWAALIVLLIQAELFT
ncbi:MAG TPA: hypothetical protein VHY35_16215 [Stellaceae bacterium]|jgi:hypothetical protein|nr:hypothetical protein [Stellaceae bacterium]